MGELQVVAAKMDTAAFVSKSKLIHGDRYDYSLVDYECSACNVHIVCRIHGDFYQSATNHLSGKGCVRCSYELRGDQKRLSLEEFVSKCRDVHGSRYGYEMAEYKGSHARVLIHCRDHGHFWQLATHHSRGSGCPKCYRQSAGELAIKTWLDKSGIRYTEQALFNGLKKCRYDFFVPSHNLLIEYDGRQHFEPVASFGGQKTFEFTKASDERKNRWAWENGYMLMRIPYWMKDRIPELLHRQLTMFTAEVA